MDFAGSTDEEITVCKATPASSGGAGSSGTAVSSKGLASVAEEPAGGSTPAKVVLKENQVDKSSPDDFVPPPPPPGPPPGQQFKLPPGIPEPGSREMGDEIMVDTVNLKPAGGDFCQVTVGDLTLTQNPHVTQTRHITRQALRSAIHCRRFNNLSREVEQMIVGLSPQLCPKKELPFRISFCVTCFNREAESGSSFLRGL